MNLDPTSETWILNGTLCTQDANRTIVQAHLHVVNGRIEKITKNLPTHLPSSTPIIDATGLTLIPGFIQAHVHLCQTLFRNQADDLELLDWLSKRIWVMEAAHTPDTLYTSASVGIHELLSSGTTCILDMGTVRHTQSIFQAVQDFGIRANVGKCLMDHPSQTPAYLRESTSNALAEAQSLFREWNGKANDRIRASYAPRFVISCTEDLLKEVSRLAREQKAIIHTHASENRKEIELVKEMTGLENVEYLHHLGLASSQLVLAHCVWLNGREKEILHQTGTHVVHCPSSNMKLASGFSPIPELREKKINVALGADGAPCNNNLNMFQEMRMAALIHKPGSGPQSMRALEVLDMATRDGAKALNWLDDIGTLEVGKKADIVALDLGRPSNTVPQSARMNPEAIASSIVYSSQSEHVNWTLVDGQLCYQKGKGTRIPESDLMKKVHEAQEFIAQKVLKELQCP